MHCKHSRNVCHREWRWLPAQLIHTRTICTQRWFDTGAQYADGGWTSPIWGLDLWRPPIWGLEAQKDEGIDQKGSLLLPPKGPVARLQGSIARSFSNDYQSCLMKSYHFPLRCFRCTLVPVHEGFGSFHQWASDCHFRIWVWFQTLSDTSECSWPKRDFNIAMSGQFCTPAIFGPCPPHLWSCLSQKLFPFVVRFLSGDKRVSQKIMCLVWRVTEVANEGGVMTEEEAEWSHRW